MRTLSLAALAVLSFFAFATTSKPEAFRFFTADGRLNVALPGGDVPLFAGLQVREFAVDDSLLVFLGSLGTLYAVNLAAAADSPAELSAYLFGRIQSPKPLKVDFIKGLAEGAPEACPDQLANQPTAIEVEVGDVALLSQEENETIVRGILSRKDIFKRFSERAPNLRSLWSTPSATLH